jgi:hypothetical protein
MFLFQCDNRVHGQCVSMCKTGVFVCTQSVACMCVCVSVSVCVKKHEAILP